MSKLKLSQWHNADVKPVHNGWYQCIGEFAESCTKPVWRKWNGKYWMWIDIYSIKHRLVRASVCVGEDKWRGIVK